MSKGTVIVGGFSHESNTFTPLTTALSDFWFHDSPEEFHPLFTEDTEYGGAYEALTHLGYAVAPVLAAGATVGGAIEYPVFTHYIKKLTQRLGHMDLSSVVGIQWVLHGSASVEGVEDVQAEILKVLTKRLPQVPVVVSMDLHSTISPQVLGLVAGLVQYRTAPHRDVFETGQRASVMLDHLIVSRTKTRRLAIKVPMLLPGEYGQTQGHVMADLLEEIARSQQQLGVFDLSLSQGFPWADNPLGVVTLVATQQTTDRIEALASEMQRLAQLLWAARHELYRSVIVEDPARAVSSVTSAKTFRVWCDAGDNPTAGGPEDRIDLLRSVLERGMTGWWFFPIVDSLFVQQCGAEDSPQVIRSRLGGRLGDSGHVMVQAHVEGRGYLGGAGHWARINVGGNHVIVTERRFGVRDPHMLEQVGLSWAGETLVVKSGYLFPLWSAFLQKTHAEARLLATSGPTTLDLTQLPYRNIPRTTFPLDAAWTAQHSMTQYIAEDHVITTNTMALEG